MTRLSVVDPNTASAEVKPILDAVKAAVGMVPNLHKVLANSPAALKAYVDFNGDLSKGMLDPKLSQQLAILVAQANHCDYCLSAHTLLGKHAGLSPDALEASRSGKDAEPKTAAALAFATKVLNQKGKVSEGDVAAVRAAGYSDGEITEIIANVALNVFTNYFNVAADVDIDFPRVRSADLK